MMPEPSTRPICGSPSEALRNAGVRSLDGITIWQGEWGCTGPISPPMAIPTERTVTERRFLYGDPCIGEECPAMHLCQEPGMRTDWLTETDRKAFGL